MAKPKSNRMILPPDFPMPGTNKEPTGKPGSAATGSRRGGGPLRMLLWPFVGMIVNNLLAVIIVPLILLGLAWWYFPTEFSWITNLVTGTGNVFDVKAWQS